jgi:hypothetical protein
MSRLWVGTVSFAVLLGSLTAIPANAAVAPDPTTVPLPVQTQVAPAPVTSAPAQPMAAGGATGPGQAQDPRWVSAHARKDKPGPVPMSAALTVRGADGKNAPTSAPATAVPCLWQPGLEGQCPVDDHGGFHAADGALHAVSSGGC